MSVNGIVVYYSRTGNTEKVAELIASKADFEAIKIIDKKDRSGLSGYMKGGWEAWREKHTEIDTEQDVAISDRGLVVIGTPVWAGKPAPAVRAYLSRKKKELGKVAFFCTLGGTGSEGTFKQLEKMTGKDPVSTLMVTEKELEKEIYEKKVKKFVDDLKG